MKRFGRRLSRATQATIREPSLLYTPTCPRTNPLLFFELARDSFKHWILSVRRGEQKYQSSLCSTQRNIYEAGRIFCLEESVVSVNRIKNHCMPFTSLSTVTRSAPAASDA